MDRVLRHEFNKVVRPLLAVPVAIGFLLFFAQDARPQQFFDVKSVIQDVQKRFSLNSTDLRHIGPLIQQDNADLLVLYARFGGTEPEYSPALWRRVIDQRLDFENRTAAKLTNRQASAVRAARGSLETRILTRIVEDYVDFLVVYLELEALEREAIEHLLQKERITKHELVMKYMREPVRLEKELETVTDRTDYWLAKILSAEQLRLYRSLYEPGPTISG